MIALGSHRSATAEPRVAAAASKAASLLSGGAKDTSRLQSRMMPAARLPYRRASEASEVTWFDDDALSAAERLSNSSDVKGVRTEELMASPSRASTVRAC